MSNHPNFDRAQAVLDAVRKGDYGPNFDLYADDIVMENGPGAGSWHRARDKDDLALMLTEFAGFFGGTFHGAVAANGAAACSEKSSAMSSSHVAIFCWFQISSKWRRTRFLLVSDIGAPKLYAQSA